MAQWTIDESHTRIGFAIRHLMLSTVRGHFNSYSGSLKIDATDFTRSEISGEIAVNSIDTGVVQRNMHLISPDFFDARRFPTITFNSTGIEQQAESVFIVTGNLTIRDITKSVAFDVEFSGPHVDPWGRQITGLSATAKIDRQEFGMTFNAPLRTGGLMIGNKVTLEVEAEFIAS